MQSEWMSYTKTQPEITSGSIEMDRHARNNRGKFRGTNLRALSARGFEGGRRVVGGAEVEFRTSRAEKELPKLTCENSVAVRDDGLG